MSDPGTLRLVALFIGALALLSVAGTIALLVTDRQADAALVGLAGTALGYLAGMLTPSSSGVAQPVNVVNRADSPVPVVDDAGHTDAAGLAVIAAVAILVVLAYHLLLR